MKSTEDVLASLDKQMGESPIAGEVTQNDAPKHDEHEEKALSLGWKPEGSKGAKQWLEDYPLLKEIKQLDRANKDLAKLLQGYINEQNTEKKQQKNLEINQIRTEAIKMGDVELVGKIDKRLEEDRQVQNRPPVDPAFTEFYDKYPQVFNPNSLQELEMKKYFLKTDADLGNHLPPAKHMKLLEEALLAKFPKYFNIENEDDEQLLTSAVESGIQSNIKKTLRKKYTERDLSPAQMATFKSFQQYKVPLTLEKYIESLVKQGDLK
jgi:hypothetical protein